MGTKLRIGNSDNLYEFWKSDLTEALNKDLKIQKTNVLVNLASNEYFSVLDKEGREFPLNSEDMKKYKSGKEEVPPYFLEFLDVL